MKYETLLKKYNFILIILAVGAVLVNIKSIFTDYNYDSGYAITLAYRILQGDHMFKQMWEPHQTSAFLCAGLMKLYHLVTGTYDGIVLYLQVMGVLIKTLFTWMIYHTLKTSIPKDILTVMCIFFYAVSPKGLPMPEFSNMQLWFSVGVFCSLISYFNEQNKKMRLILTGVFLSLEILAYPSCLIVFLGVLLLICFYSSKKRKDMIIITIVCFLLGSIYCCYFIRNVGVDGFLTSIGNVISGDGSHGMSLGQKFMKYAKELGSMLRFLIGYGMFSGVIAWLMKKVDYFKVSLKRYWVLVFFIMLLVRDVVLSVGIHMEYDERLPIYIPFLIVALYTANACDKNECRIVVIGLVISMCGFVATLLLTNLTIAATLNYLVLGMTVAFFPIIKKVKETDTLKGKMVQFSIIILFCSITILRNGYIIKCMSTEKTNIFKVGGIVTNGPAKGIVSEHMGPYVLNHTFEEWKKHIKPGDKVLIVSDLYDPIYYMYEDVEISATSTICTPTYDEMLLEYWEKNPDKYPNVVVIDCWFGEERVESDSWIMNWVRNEFDWTTQIDGMYWRYYKTG